MAPPSPIPRLADIIEASRRLPDDLNARYPSIPWPKVAGIGNVLRPPAMLLTAPG